MAWDNESDSEKVALIYGIGAQLSVCLGRWAKMPSWLFNWFELAV